MAGAPAGTIAPVDLNGDGKDELLRYNGAGRVVVTQFSASLAGITNKYDGTGWGSGRTFSFPDLDGDGRAEVVRHNPAAGSLVVTRFNSALTGFTNTYQGNGWGTSAQILHADLDGDGIDELFRYSGTGSVIVTEFNGALSGFANRYSGTGWGSGVEMSFAESERRRRRGGLPLCPRHRVGVVVTQFNAALTGFTNKYTGDGWGKHWAIHVR